MIIAGKDRCIKCMQSLKYSGACSCCGFDESEYVASASALKPGTCLNNRYFIGCVLGQGGFGITYSAWDIMLAVKVAIKEYYPAEMVGRGSTDKSNTVVFVQNNEYQSRYDKGLREFLREARTLAQFAQLRGIVSIRDFFGENNTAYIVMEYVEGIPVSRYVKQNGPFTGEQLLEKMEPILASLDIVHELGYLHRDISANNIMYMTDGELKLIDFGAARMIENEDATITVSVKRGYSPSEQYLTKGNLGAWTDVYSVCATMYYMLTGNVPDDSIERVIEDRLEPLADIESVNLDKNIKMAIDKGMAVKDENRFRRIRELYKVMYPDKDAKREKVQFFSENIDKKNDGKHRKPYSKTLLKNELDEIIKNEKKQKQRKRLYTIIGAVLAAVLTVCVIVYLNNDNKEGMAHSAGEVVTDTISPVSDSSSVHTTVSENEPKEGAPEPENKPEEDAPEHENESETSETPEPEETMEPVGTKTSVATKEPAVTKETVATKEPAVTKKPVATKKPAVKRTPEPSKKPVATKKPVAAKKPVERQNQRTAKTPSKGSKGDDSVGTLDGL